MIQIGFGKLIDDILLEKIKNHKNRLIKWSLVNVKNSSRQK